MEKLSANAGFQLYFSAFDADRVLNFLAAAPLELFRFLLDEALEFLKAWRARFFSRRHPRINQRSIETVYFSRFAGWI